MYLFSILFFIVFGGGGGGDGIAYPVVFTGKEQNSPQSFTWSESSVIYTVICNLH